jgi:hypothetical protein
MPNFTALRNVFILLLLFCHVSAWSQEVNKPTIIRWIGKREEWNKDKLMYYRPYWIVHHLSHEDGASDYMVIPIDQDTLGQLYHISMELHMDPFYFQDTFMRKHFGIAVANDLPTDNWYLRTTTFYSFNKWIQDSVTTVKFNYRLQCKGRYLLVGVFKRGHYSKEICDLCGISFRVNGYTISKISDVDTSKCVYFCHADSSKKIPEPVFDTGPDSVVINYSLGSDVISIESFKSLTSFINSLKKDNSLVNIRAYTDRIGNNNYELSNARIRRIKGILVDSFGVDTFRLLIDNFGEKLAVRHKSADERKVVLRKTYYQLSHLYYEKALNSLKEGDSRSAFKNLSLWLKNVDFDNAILFIFDCRFFALKNTPAYQGLVDQIKKKVYRNSKLVFDLDSIYFEDQRYRTLMSSIYGNHIYKDSFEINCLQDQKTETQIQVENEQFIESLYKKHGFVVEEEVGTRAFHSFIYVILHSKNLTWQKSWLPRFENECLQSKLPWKWYATLSDKISILETGKQIYGTQVSVDENGKLNGSFIPIQIPQKVNERRARFAMAPIQVK